MNEQLDLFYTGPAPEKPKPARQTAAPIKPDGEQLAFYDEPEQEIFAALYMRIWDKEGLQMKGFADNWYRFREGSQTAKAKALAKVRRRIDQIISTGLVARADIVTTESHMTEYVYEQPEPITLKHYPQSSTTIEEKNV